MNNIYFDNDKLVMNYHANKIKFKIKAEAVQAEYNNSDVLELEGWPQ